MYFVKKENAWKAMYRCSDDLSWIKCSQNLCSLKRYFVPFWIFFFSSVLSEYSCNLDQVVCNRSQDKRYKLSVFICLCNLKWAKKSASHMLPILEAPESLDCFFYFMNWRKCALTLRTTSRGRPSDNAHLGN